MGPQFRRTTVFVANATRQPLQDAPAWQHRFPQTDVIIEFVLNSNTTAGEFEVTSGDSVLVQRGPIPGGGAAGVFLAFQDNKGNIVGFAGNEIAFTLFETAGAAMTTQLEVHLTPV